MLNHNGRNERPNPFAGWTNFIPESEIRRLLQYNVRYYYGGGKPGVLPLKTFSQIFKDLAEKEFDAKIGTNGEAQVLDYLNYGETPGKHFLRQVLAERLRSREKLAFLDKEEGWKDVFISSGSQQACYAILDSLLNPGDLVITPKPAYLGFLVPVVKLGGEAVTVSTDGDGMIPEILETAINLCVRKLHKIPKAVYLVPTSDNPKGTTVPVSRRKQIFDICASWNILLIEDNPYKEIQFNAESGKFPGPPPLKAYDTENEHVAYLCSSSKEAAVLRMGYSILPPDLREVVIKTKGYLDLCSSTLSQKVLEIYYRDYFDKALPETIAEYKRRYEAMSKALDESFPVGTRTHPTGGFFIWWEAAKKEFDTKRFLADVAIPEEVLFVPGHDFYPLKGHAVRADSNKLHDNIVKTNAMRLSFSFKSPENIEEGMPILGRLLTDALG
ncbi:MAG: PLP-dependent aminotransferase family protein [Candidatus Heimdallarchaeota archaeon]